MRKRLYFLLSDLDSARNIVDELLLARIEAPRIHVLAREGTSLGNLPEATLLETSDIVHGIESGLIIGGISGFIAGIAASLVLSLDTSMTGVIILVCTLIAALFGIWMSSMIGSDVRNSRLKEFESALNDGKILLMVDVPSGRIVDIKNKVSAHKQAQTLGEEPSIPAFP
ncbi:MAG TPA: DUF1269 domain-containing protein [Gammaproteobacteria bacterium]